MKLVILAAAIGLAWPAIAVADPCEGVLPRNAGVRFTGTVRYVVDGDGFCVGASADPSTWIEVRTADFNAAEYSTREGRDGQRLAQAALMGQPIVCTSTAGRSGRVITYDRVLAVCSVRGRRVRDILRAAGVAEGGS